MFQCKSDQPQIKRNVISIIANLQVASRVVERLKTKLSLLQEEKKHIEDLAKKEIKPTQANGALHHKFIDESDRQILDQDTQQRLTKT